MHELAIAQSIVEAVEARAGEHNAARVKAVRLRIGEASGVVIESLSACFEMLTSLTPMLEGAQLLIDLVPHRARCRCCDSAFAVVDFITRCPACGEWSSEIISGTELQILEMEI